MFEVIIKVLTLIGIIAFYISRSNSSVLGDGPDFGTISVVFYGDF